MFINMNNLTILYLSRNKITEIEPYSFQNLKKLTELSLSGNQLEKIKWNI